MSKRNIWVYLTIVFIVSFAIQYGIDLKGGVESKAFRWMAQILMWVPGLLAIGMRIFTKEGFKNAGLRIGKLEYYPLAIFLPVLITFLYMFISLGLGLSGYNSELINFKGGLVNFGKGIGMVLGTNSQTVVYFLLNFIVTMIFGSIFSGILTMGEELGWRSYLLPKMTYNFGLVKGILLTGLIWGYWHFPIILMGYNFPQYPVLGAFILMPFSTVCLGTISAFLYFKSESLFPAVLFHSSVNLSMGLVEALLLTKNLSLDLLHLFLWAVFALGFLVMLRKRPESKLALDYGKR
jgi:uncharacterized protein